MTTAPQLPPPPDDLPQLRWFNLLYNRVLGVNPTVGLTLTVTTAKLTALGVNGSLTFTNGVLTSSVQAT